ncbi:hypothetical protein PCK1_001986 [Pneumocystis canis]|nr:hypothetical protein PCK1_001986 [Pneumocystis canis]
MKNNIIKDNVSRLAKGNDKNSYIFDSSELEGECQNIKNNEIFGLKDDQVSFGLKFRRSSNKIKDTRNLKLKKNRSVNLNADRNGYCVFSSTYQDNENISNISEIFDDNETLLSYDDYDCIKVPLGDARSNVLGEFVEILEKKKNQDFSKIDKISKKISYEIFNSQTKLIENNCSNDSAFKKLSLSEMISSLEKKTIINSYLKSFFRKKTSKFSNNALSLPLPKSIQDRLDREAAYDIVKKDLKKWEDIVKLNRGCQTLKFPFDSIEKTKLTNNSLAAKFKVSTFLEKSIDNVLQFSGLKDQKSAFEFEELSANKFSVKDVSARRIELRLMRELIFRQECKAKRNSKIKSKLYRKIHRYEKKKIKSLVLNEMDCDKFRLQKEINKAKERMNLRHSNASKYIGKVLDNDYSSVDSRRFTLEQSQRDDQFKTKVQGTYFSDFENLDNEDKNNIVSGKEDSLVNLREFNQNENTKLLKNLMSMQFMKKNENISMKNDETINELLSRKDSEILSLGYDKDVKDSGCLSGFIGRKIFCPSNKECVSDINYLESIEIPKCKQLLDMKDKKLNCIQSLKSLDIPSDHHNPWLSASDKSLLKSCESKLEHDEGQFILHKSLEDYKVDRSGLYIDLSEGLLSLTGTEEQNRYTSDIKKGDINMVYSSSVFALKHKDLVARAFSGDNVVEQFEEEKYDDIKENESYEDVLMPGWGNWCGPGIKQVLKKSIKKVSGVLERNRKKSKLKNIIINEKRIKKNTKLLVSSVPYPYQTREQYEMSLRLPYGPEWTTRGQYQKLITPPIIIKQGSIIEPLKIS